jgi:ribose 5-phosphate isomerase B
MFDKTQVIPIGADHAGVKLKDFLIAKLVEEGYKFKDFGTFTDNNVDYPDFIHPVAELINMGSHEFGVIICGSGQGAAMTANKYPHVRAGLGWNLEQTKLIRLHNNANIISLPGRFIDFQQAVEVVKVFLNTDFEGGRHENRIRKIPISE